jgi:hypothetical protein
MSTSEHDRSLAISLVQRIAGQFALLDKVEAVAISGSQTSQLYDANSDVDLYVYVTETVPLEVRRQIAAGASRSEIGNEYWEPGDEWLDQETGIAVDMMFRHVAWIEEQLNRVLRHHQASVGYSTCFWYNVRYSQVLFDRRGWLRDLKNFSDQAYPPELKRAIIAKNFPLLRQNLSSYQHQIELAIARKDPVSVNHRVTALLASYFDVLFAVNELPHPGEKRLIAHALTQCQKIPPNMPEMIKAVLASAQAGDTDTASQLNLLIDGLEGILASEGLS